MFSFLEGDFPLQSLIMYYCLLKTLNTNFLISNNPITYNKGRRSQVKIIEINESSQMFISAQGAQK